MSSAFRRILGSACIKPWTLVGDTALRVLAANNTPDSRTISDFRSHPLGAC